MLATPTGFVGNVLRSKRGERSDRDHQYKKKHEEEDQENSDYDGALRSQTQTAEQPYGRVFE
jgi:hypothetical protein